MQALRLAACTLSPFTSGSPSPIQHHNPVHKPFTRLRYAHESIESVDKRELLGRLALYEFEC